HGHHARTSSGRSTSGSSSIFVTLPPHLGGPDRCLGRTVPGHPVEVALVGQELTGVDPGHRGGRRLRGTHRPGDHRGRLRPLPPAPPRPPPPPCPPPPPPFRRPCDAVADLGDRGRRREQVATGLLVQPTQDRRCRRRAHQL